MEIERKYKVHRLPDNIDSYPRLEIEQAYLNTKPVIRIRKQDNLYYLTYKGEGFVAREEYNLPLNESSYYHLRNKADGIRIAKTRYLIPLNHPSYTQNPGTFSESLMIELDIFHAPFDSMVLAEVEFATLEEANAFLPPDWFAEDVSDNPAFHNSNMSGLPQTGETIPNPDES